MCNTGNYVEVKQYDMKGKKIPKEKQWDSEILKTGGVSYWYIKDIDKVKLADNDIKEKYKVSMCLGDNTKTFKWKIRTASDEIFSVSAKGQQEAQLVVDEVFGVGMYRVSQFLVG